MSGNPSRRTVLRTGVFGGTALAALGQGLAHAAAQDPAEVASEAQGGVSYNFNQNWLFGGQYVPGSEAPGYPDSGFANITLPHSVVPLSWGDWDPTAWEHVWIYRRRPA